MTSEKDMVLEELAQAGTVPEITPALIQLDEYRVTTESKLHEEEFLLSIKGMPCFPRGDLSTITGQAKSGKTSLIVQLMACCTMPQGQQCVLDMHRNSTEPLRVMWVDTEQSPQSTLSILKHRVVPMVCANTEKDTFPEELFYVFNIRKADITERYNLLAEGVKAYHPDLIVIDNVRDLTHDINDGQKSQELIEQLMHMASENQCNVTCVIHQNRSNDNRGLRGWLGTEMMNKVFEVFTCQKMHQKEDVRPTFCVEQTMTRKYDIDGTLCYQLDDNGLPVVADERTAHRGNVKGRYISRQDTVQKFNREYIIDRPDDATHPWQWNLQKLFADAMGGWEMRNADDLENRARELSNIRQKAYYDKVLEAAINEGIVKRVMDRYGRPVVMAT